MFLCGLGFAVVLAVCFGLALRRRRMSQLDNILGKDAAPRSTAGARSKAAPPGKGKGDSRSVAVDIEAHAAPAPPASPPPLLALSSAVARAVDECKRAGVAVNADQPAASFAELDARVRGLLAGYLAAGHADWRQYAQWNEHHYTRHLVDSCDEYELMLICWAPGQRSRVHNHAGSHCWLTVVDGGVEESLYAPVAAGGGGEERSAAPALPGVLGATRPCPPLHHLATAQLGAGGVAYINDKVALHAVGCPQICPGQGAVTLHLYCPPIRRVNLFEEDNNRVVQRVPGFFTVRGQKSAAA